MSGDHSADCSRRGRVPDRPRPDESITANVTRFPMPREKRKRRPLMPVAVSVAIISFVAMCAAWWGRRHYEASPLDDARASYSRGDWPEAERFARKQLRNERDDPEALRLLSRALLRQANDESVPAILDKLNRETMTAEVYFLVGQLCVRSGQIDLAIKRWQEAVRKDFFSHRSGSSRAVPATTDSRSEQSPGFPCVPHGRWRPRDADPDR